MVDEGSTLSLLQRVLADDDDSLLLIEELEDLAKTQQLRDIEFAASPELCRAINSFALHIWGSHEGGETQKLVNNFLGCLITFPEFDETAQRVVFDVNLATECLNHIISDLNSDTKLLQNIIYRTYKLHEQSRGALRVKIGSAIELCLENESWVGVPAILELLTLFVQGFRTPVSDSNMVLLTGLLCRLHAVEGKCSPSEATLSLFHQPLVLCISEFVRKNNDLGRFVVQDLLRKWPSAREGNSPKEVLFLHELENMIALTGSFNHKMVLGKLVDCIASDNSTVAERALLFWKNDTVADRICFEDTCHSVIQVILNSAISHWNKTVTVMASHVLGNLLAKYPEAVLKTSAVAWNKPTVEKKDIQDLINKVAPPKVDKKPNVNKTRAAIPAKQPDIGFMNMILGDELGDGSFSKVYYALKASPGRPRSEWVEYALKRMNSKHRDVALREAEMMDRLSHPNCTRLIGMYESAGSINLVLEYAGSGDLHTLLSKLGSLDEAASRFIAGEVASALDYIHKNDLIFGDLKPENVLIHSNGHVKLGDFGATRSMEIVREGSDPIEGTLCYLAPELFRSRSTSGEELVRIPQPEAIDWWAYGCLVYQMLSGQPPVKICMEEKELVERLVKFNIGDKFPSEFPLPARNLVENILVHDPKLRFGIKEIEQHEFFDGIDSVHELFKTKAPEYVPGKVKVVGGRWTQRTYSMIVAPLPQDYSDTYVSLSWNPIEETELEMNHSWTGSANLKRIVKPSLPKLTEELDEHQMGASVSASFTSRKVEFSAGIVLDGKRNKKFNPMSVMPKPAVAPGQGRRPPRSAGAKPGGKYSVKGLDLTAG